MNVIVPSLPSAAADLSLRELPRDLVDDLADDGVAVEIIDVIAGANPWAVDCLVDVHAHAFPGYAFVIAEIEANADAPSRNSLIVHQWLVMHGGEPAGCVLFDCNLTRRVAVVHFLAITRRGRGVRVDGHRLAWWLCRRVATTLRRELDEHRPGSIPLGVFGESPARLVRRWRGAGFRQVDVTYAEPVAGRGWRDVTNGGDPAMRPLTLLWLPGPGIGIEEAATAGAAGAAAFLIDHYRLPLDHPVVVAATGSEHTRPGARR
jgi:hypothetical protein